MALTTKQIEEKERRRLDNLRCIHQKCHRRATHLYITAFGVSAHVCSEHYDEWIEPKSQKATERKS